jgi:hypothetical protein
MLIPNQIARQLINLVVLKLVRRVGWLKRVHHLSFLQACKLFLDMGEYWETLTNIEKFSNDDLVFLST